MTALGFKNYVFVAFGYGRKCSFIVGKQGRLVCVCEDVNEGALGSKMSAKRQTERNRVVKSHSYVSNRT